LAGGPDTVIGAFKKWVFDMCGIAGIVGLNASAPPVVASELDFLNMKQKHRGPDGQGIWTGPKSRVGFAHVRLAIIDLSESGHQPMIGNNGCAITYNGEVYNHVELRNSLVDRWEFKSRSDTEVLLAAYSRWGSACVDRFRGMFSFAIYDPRRNTTLLVRDRMGIKPLYYAVVNDRLIFASEIKAILPFLDSVEIDPDGLANYLTYQFTIGETTMFKGVHSLPPGHSLQVEDGKIKIHAYWNVQYQIDTDHTPTYFSKKLQDIIDRSVRLHLRSDVPVGCYLSGGVDSSLIALLASQHDQGNRNAFHGKFTEYKGYDESRHARIVAEQAGKHLHEMDMSCDHMLDSIDKIVYHLDQPTAGPGSIPQYLVSEMAAKSVKVVLGGQGGDEIFAGYARYLVAYFEQTLKAAIEGTHNDGRFVVTPESIVPNLVSLKEYKPMLANFWRDGLFGNLDARYFRLVDRFSDVEGEIQPGIVDKTKIFEEFQSIFNDFRSVHSRSYLDRMTHFDLKTLLPALLHVEDRVSMAHGLESRVPFVDHELVEFMATVPADIKFRDGSMKIMLKEAFGGMLPRTIMERTDKMGFPVPLAEWYNGKLGIYVRDIFNSQSARERDIFDSDNVMKAIGGSSKFSRKTWGLLSLELWMRAFIDKGGAMRAEREAFMLAAGDTPTHNIVKIAGRDRKPPAVVLQ
jgi:asparagine synthase (glutamine-hydrolysing)